MNKMKRIKGVTLIELTIVLALLSIVSVMIISFAILTSNYTVSITKDDSVLDDLESCNKTFETWISAFDSSDYTITFEDGDGENHFASLKATDSTKTYTLSVTSEHLLIGFMPNGQKVTLALTSEITSFVFSKYNSGSNNLITLTVDYSLYNRQGTSTYDGSKTFIKAIRLANVNVEVAS